MARSTRPAGRRGGNNLALRVAAVRRWHSYMGAFIAPTILFFALTGSLQIFRLHEAGGSYRPVPVLEKLGMLHKDQLFVAKPKRPAPSPGAKAPRPAPPAEAAPAPATEALKWFFLACALGLAASTLLGLWMGLVHSAQRAVLWLLLLAGAAIPIALVVAA